jgi:hypothetical protein
VIGGGLPGRRDAAKAILKPLPSGSLAVEQAG